MKKSIFNCILLSLIGWILVSNAAAMELTIACENKQDFPTVMGNSTDILTTNPGMGVEAVYQLEKRLNLKITIKRLPWKRCLAEMKKGNVQGVFTASFKEERKDFGRYPEIDGKVDPSRRFTSASYALYRMKGSDVQFDGKKFDIKGKVGAPSGYSIVDDLKKRGLDVDEGPSTENDFKKMMKGRIHAVAALEMTGDYYLMVNQDMNQTIEKVDPLIVEKPYYFMISYQFYESNKELAEKIWTTIAEIRMDPDFQKQLKNYF
ncbi:MAG: transporter substrate-binding domain-containing protein [Candidatus Magnetomorum sp.]|nr:transporter substrate-binding domain-containing protein [Candidatus Magnetomorum sp.]